MESIVFDRMSLLKQYTPYEGQIKSNIPKDNDVCPSLLANHTGYQKQQAPGFGGSESINAKS
jgi:hypothetical protein